MAEPAKNSFLRDMVREVLGEWIGFRYFQRGSAAQPGTSAIGSTTKGSLLVAIYKANLTPAKRQQALAFNKFLEEKNPFGKSRLEEALVNTEGLANMLEKDTPAEWLDNIPRSSLQHLQTSLGMDEAPKVRRWFWLRTGLRWLCIILLAILAFWIAFPQFHN